MDEHSRQKPLHLQDRGWRIRAKSLEKTKLSKLREQIGCPDTGLPKDEDLYQAIKQHMSRFTTSNNIAGADLKTWTTKNRLRFTEMAVSFLEYDGNGAHFWPDAPEAHARNLKYSHAQGSIKIERLLVQLFWRINNPEEESSQSVEAPRGSSPYDSDDSWGDSITSRRGNHADEPTGVDGHTHEDITINPNVTQDNRDTNDPPVSFPRPRPRTFEPLEEPPTNEYEIQNTGNTFGGRDKSLPRAPEAPMVNIGHWSPTVAESSTAAQNRVSSKIPAIRANLKCRKAEMEQPRNRGDPSVQPRTSSRVRRQIPRKEFREWREINRILDSPSPNYGPGNLHYVDSSSSAQNPSPNHLPTPPSGQREGTSFTLGRLEEDVHMEDALPDDTLRPENAGRLSNVDADARAQARMPSPELNTTPAPQPLQQQEVQSTHIDGLVPVLESHQGDTRDGPRTISETPLRETIEEDEIMESRYEVAEGSQRLPRLKGNLTAIPSNQEEWTFPVGDFSRASLQEIKAKSHIHHATPVLLFTLDIPGKKCHWEVISNDSSSFDKMRSAYLEVLEKARRGSRVTSDEEYPFHIYLKPI